MLSIARLIRSAADPWQSELIACRSACARSSRLFDRMCGRKRLRPESVSTKPSIRAVPSSSSWCALTPGCAACHPRMSAFASSSETAICSVSRPGPARGWRTRLPWPARAASRRGGRRRRGAPPSRGRGRHHAQADERRVARVRHKLHLDLRVVGRDEHTARASRIPTVAAAAAAAAAARVEQPRARRAQRLTPRRRAAP